MYFYKAFSFLVVNRLSTKLNVSPKAERGETIIVQVCETFIFVIFRLKLGYLPELECSDLYQAFKFVTIGLKLQYLPHLIRLG